MSAFSTRLAALSPRAWWRMGDASGTVMADSSGNGRHGAYTGAVTLGAPGAIAGDSDTAVTINTTSQEAHVNYDATWMNQTTLCWGIWFKTTKTSRQYLMTRNFTYAGLDIDAGSVARFYCTIAGTLYTITAAVAGLMDGNWHFIVGRYNGATMDLFVDGTKVATEAHTGNLSANSNGIGFGYRADSTGVNRFVGSLDEAFILPSTVTDADIAGLWTDGSSGPTPPSVTWLWPGAVSDTAFTVTAKVGAGVSVRLGVEAGSTLTTPTYGSAVTADADGYVTVTTSGLSADTPYSYGLELDGALDPTVGHVTTLPAAGTAASFEFAHGSCIANGSNHRVFDAIRVRGPLMMQQMGDFHYANISTNSPGSFRAAYDGQLAGARLGALVEALPMDYVWDDHDFGADNSNSSSASKPAAQSVYRQLAPHYPLPAADAIYHSYQIGRVKFIATDLRSYRNSNGTTDSSTKTMLGAAQKAWFKSELDAAAADAGVGLVVWLSSQVYNTDGTTGVNYDADSWASFTYERAELADYIRDAGLASKMFLVVGDAHMLAYDDGALSDFATGGGAPIPQFCAASLDEVGLVRGDNWSGGTYPGGGQFGYFTFTDDGTTISWSWEGVRVDPTTGAETIMLTVSGVVGGATAIAVSRWDGASMVTGTLLGRWNGASIDAAASLTQT